MCMSSLLSVDPWWSPVTYVVFACAGVVWSESLAGCLWLCQLSLVRPSVSSTQRNSQEGDCTHGEGRDRSGSFRVQPLITNNSSIIVPSRCFLLTPMAAGGRARTVCQPLFLVLYSVMCPPRAIHRGRLGLKPLECPTEKRQSLRVGSEARRDLTPAWSLRRTSRPAAGCAAWCRRAAPCRGARAGPRQCHAPLAGQSVLSLPALPFAGVIDFLILEIDLRCSSWSLACPQAAGAGGPFRASGSAGGFLHWTVMCVSLGLVRGGRPQRSSALTKRESVVGPQCHTAREAVLPVDPCSPYTPVLRWCIWLTLSQKFIFGQGGMRAVVADL